MTILSYSDGELQITVGEAAAMYRLRVLYEACTSLLDVLRRLIDWNNGNIKVGWKINGIEEEHERCISVLTTGLQIIRKHTKKLTLLPYANTMIEATAAIGEIFRLESIDLSSIKVDKIRQID